jgi:hypothetical protein
LANLIDDASHQAGTSSQDQGNLLYNGLDILVGFELAFLWCYSMCNLFIAHHDFQSCVLAFCSSEKILKDFKSIILMHGRKKSSRLDLCSDLVKKLHVKIGLCFYKIVHAKEIAMMHYSGQPKVNLNY